MEAGILALQILVILAAGRCSMRIAFCFLVLFLLLRFSVLQQVSNLLCEALCKLGKVFERLQKRLHCAAAMRHTPIVYSGLYFFRPQSPRKNAHHLPKLFAFGAILDVFV